MTSPTVQRPKQDEIDVRLMGCVIAGSYNAVTLAGKFTKWEEWHGGGGDATNCHQPQMYPVKESIALHIKYNNCLLIFSLHCYTSLQTIPTHHPHHPMLLLSLILKS